MSQPTQPGQSNEAAPIVDDLDPQDPSILIDQWYAKYKDMPYKELAERMVELKAKAGEADRTKKALDAEHDVIRLRVVPERFQKDGMTSLRLQGIGRLGLTSDAYCTVIPGAKPDLLEYLKKDPENALLVKEDINPSTLKSLVKGLAEEDIKSLGEADLESAASGEAEEPESEFKKILQYVSYTPFMRASVTKG